MSVIRSATGMGIVILGTIVMGSGYILSKSAPVSLGKMTTVALGLQLEQIGFMLVVGGILAWIMISLLSELRVV
jgi:hypothetical protein